MKFVHIVARAREAVVQLTYWPQGLQLIWSAAPRWTAGWGLLLFVQGFLPVAIVYLTRTVVNRLVAAVDMGGTWETLQSALLPIALLAGVMLLKDSLQSILEWVRAVQAELVHDRIAGLIHRKSVAVDLAFYESPDFFDRLDRARSDAASRSISLLESTGSLLQNTITLLAMSAVLAMYGILLPIMLILSTIPALFMVMRYNRRYHRWWERRTTDRRWLAYFDGVLTHRDAAAELRLFDSAEHFRSAYRSLRNSLRIEGTRLIRNRSLARLGAGAISLLMAGATMAWMVWRAAQGWLTLGDLALFYQAFNQGQGLVRTLLGNVGEIYNSGLFLQNLFDFLALEPQLKEPAEPVVLSPTPQRKIAFRNVAFRYPASGRFALKGFNLTVHAGQVAAIVGANGSGKTTMVKLLCRFYDPETGAVEIDGVDLRSLSIRQLRRMVTLLFQVPLRYNESARNNIAIGDLSRWSDTPDIEASARGAGAHDFIARLSHGYDTLLGKYFISGTELSEGEWQRVALARAYLRRSDIVVLDEPTSALDSWSESDWFERFRRMTNGRTAIIITHRLTIARRADVIHVMDQGTIVESGTHDELLTMGGPYAQSWLAQMQSTPEPM